MPEYDYDQDDDDSSSDQSQGGNDSFQQLRAHARELEKQLKATKAQSKELDELRSFKAQADAALRRSQVVDLFKQLGVREGYAKWYPADQAATPEGVAAWVRENAELVGIEVT